MKIGTARRDITPAVGTELTGYIGRPQPAARVHDELCATVLVLDDGDTRVGLISADLLSVSAERDAALRADLSKATGIPPANWLIATSHTHAGPAEQFLRGCGQSDEHYLKWAGSQIVAAAREACESATSGSASFVRATSDMGQNRRSWVVEQGRQASPTSGTITDPEIAALLFRSGAGRSVLVFNYACHGVTLLNDNSGVSADWIGVARSVLEERPDVDLSIFLQGCCGDINPRLRGTLADLKLNGEAVAHPLLGALPNATAIPDPKISVAWTEVELPLLPLPSEEELEMDISFRRSEIERKRAEGVARTALEADQAMLSWAEDALTAVRDGGAGRCVKLPIQAISIGDVALVGLPGEVFCEIGLTVKKMSKTQVMVVGYANGNIGYIPTAAAYEEGGYEVNDAYRYYGLQMIGPQSADIILAAIPDLLARVQG